MTALRSIGSRLLHSKLSEKFTDALARWLYSHECVVAKSRLFGQLTCIPWEATNVSVSRGLIDVWKSSRAEDPSDLLAGMGGWRDLWRRRGLFCFTLRVGSWELMWENSQHLGYYDRRRARQRATVRRKLEAEEVADRLRAESRQGRQGPDIDAA